jgi:hypothetical protein
LEGRVLPLLLAACAATIRVEVPASPAVLVSVDRIAVVTHDRRCQPAADALARQLRRSGWTEVHPTAEYRLVVFSCGVNDELLLEHEEDGAVVRRRASVEARAHAVAAVHDGDRVLAHLIGAGTDEVASGWTNPVPLSRLRRTARERACDDLARDLVQQINPRPTLVERRVYPKAQGGTSRELTTLAVRAEQSGDLAGAISYAEAAWTTDPNPRTLGYLDELRRRDPP